MVVVLDPQFGKSALIMAAEFGHLETLKVLIDAGADINAQSKVLSVTNMLWCLRIIVNCSILR